MRRASSQHTSGATILEAAFAAALLAVFLAKMFELNARNLQLLRSGKESYAATLVLEERLEQVRRGKWADITSPAFLQAIFSNAASASGQLPELSERITVSPYPAATPPAGANTLTRSAAGVLALDPPNPNLPKEDLVRVDLRITWSGTPAGRPRSREISTLVAVRGLITR